MEPLNLPSSSPKLAQAPETSPPVDVESSEQGAPRQREWLATTIVSAAILVMALGAVWLYSERHTVPRAQSLDAELPSPSNTYQFEQE